MCSSHYLFPRLLFGSFGWFVLQKFLVLFLVFFSCWMACTILVSYPCESACWAPFSLTPTACNFFNSTACNFWPGVECMRRAIRKQSQVISPGSETVAVSPVKSRTWAQGESYHYNFAGFTSECIMSHRIQLSRDVGGMSLWCVNTFTVVKRAPGQGFGSLKSENFSRTQPNTVLVTVTPSLHSSWTAELQICRGMQVFTSVITSR